MDPLSFSCTAGPTTFTARADRKSTRLNSSHLVISYAVFCLKKKNSAASIRVGESWLAQAGIASIPRGWHETLPVNAAFRTRQLHHAAERYHVADLASQ